MGECRAIRNVVILDLLPCSTLRLASTPPCIRPLSLELERERDRAESSSPTSTELSLSPYSSASGGSPAGPDYQD